MYLDKALELARAQAIVASAYTTNTVDLDNPSVANRIGSGEDLTTVWVVTTSAAGDSASFTDTFDFLVVSSAAENLSGHTELIKRRIAAALLVAGYTFEVPIPKGRPTQRYIGGRVEVGSGDTVSVSCYIVPRDFVQDFTAYAKGYAV